MMKTNSSVSADTAQLKLLAAVIDGFRQESSAIVDTSTLDLFTALATGLRKCANKTSQVQANDQLAV